MTDMPTGDSKPATQVRPPGCPFHAATEPVGAAAGPVYRRPWGVGQNHGVRAEIARLDARRDCQVASRDVV